EVVDAEEQEEAVARRGLVRTHQGGMLVRAPLVEADQDGSIRVQDLAEVVMSRRRLGLAEERLVPFEAARYVSYADDCPRAFHDLGFERPHLELLPGRDATPDRSDRRPRRGRRDRRSDPRDGNPPIVM